MTPSEFADQMLKDGIYDEKEVARRAKAAGIGVEELIAEARARLRNDDDFDEEGAAEFRAIYEAVTV